MRERERGIIYNNKSLIYNNSSMKLNYRPLINKCTKLQCSCKNQYLGLNLDQHAFKMEISYKYVNDAICGQLYL